MQYSCHPVLSGCTVDFDQKHRLRPDEKLLTIKDYRWWIAGTTSDFLTVSVRNFALPILAFALTGSAVLAGSLITISSAILVTLVLVGGVLVDRIDPRVCMIWRASLGALT